MVSWSVAKWNSHVLKFAFSFFMLLCFLGICLLRIRFTQRRVDVMVKKQQGEKNPSLPLSLIPLPFTPQLPPSNFRIAGRGFECKKICIDFFTSSMKGMREEREGGGRRRKKVRFVGHVCELDGKQHGRGEGVTSGIMSGFAIGESAQSIPFTLSFSFSPSPLLLHRFFVFSFSSLSWLIN